MSFFLGSNIDIHAGGIDLRFPHHENEEAQSCAYFCKDQWVSYWLHTGHVHLSDSVKMSKSLKNSVSIQELLEKTSSSVFRFACVMSHYRSHMEYSEQLLTTAENVLNKFKYLICDIDAFMKGQLRGCINPDILNAQVDETCSTIYNSFADDFDTPSAITALNKLTVVTNQMLHSTASSSQGIFNSYPLLAIIGVITNTLGNLGINIQDAVLPKNREFADIMNILNEFRQSVRLQGIKNKDQELLKLCDNVRRDIKMCGITIQDYGKQSLWVK